MLWNYFSLGRTEVNSLFGNLFGLTSEKNIIPNLNEAIEIVYLNGKKTESKYSKEFISKALYSLKVYWQICNI